MEKDQRERGGKARARRGRGWRRAPLRDSSASAPVPTASNSKPAVDAAQLAVAAYLLQGQRSETQERENQLPSLTLPAAELTRRPPARGRGWLHHTAESVAPLAIATRVPLSHDETPGSQLVTGLDR